MNFVEKVKSNKAVLKLMEKRVKEVKGALKSLEGILSDLTCDIAKINGKL